MKSRIEERAPASAGGIQTLPAPKGAGGPRIVSRDRERDDVEAHDFKVAGRLHGDRVQEIIRRCAERHGVTVEAIKGHGRQRHLVKARYEAIEIVARVFPQFSTPHLGKLFGDRDHTSILHALGRTTASQNLKHERK